jgi:hypothetical protein
VSSSNWEAAMTARGCAFTTIDGMRVCRGTGADAGLCDLGHTGLLAIDGEGGVRFAQNYFTNDAAQLSPGRAQRAALCNLKGRVVADFVVVAASPSRLLLWLDRRMVPALQAFLRTYAMFGKVTLVDWTERAVACGLVAADAATAGALALRAGVVLPPPSPFAVAAGEGTLAIALPGRTCRHLVILDGERSLPGDMPVADSRRWLLADIDGGTARVTPATSEQFLPQMLNLDVDGAVSFAKGCYLGQEIVTRAQHRGEVKRRLRRLHGAGAGGTAVAAGDPVLDGAGDGVGTVVNAIHDGEGLHALAVLPRDLAQDAVLLLDGMPCRVIDAAAAIP